MIVAHLRMCRKFCVAACSTGPYCYKHTKGSGTDSGSREWLWFCQPHPMDGGACVAQIMDGVFGERGLTCEVRAHVRHKFGVGGLVSLTPRMEVWCTVGTKLGQLCTVYARACVQQSSLANGPPPTQIRRARMRASYIGVRPADPPPQICATRARASRRWARPTKNATPPLCVMHAPASNIGLGHRTPSPKFVLRARVRMQEWSLPSEPPTPNWRLEHACTSNGEVRLTEPFTPIFRHV